MKTRMNKLIIAGLFAAIPLGSVFAAAEKEAPELKNYTRTGQYETCLTNHQIRSTQILNRKQILVKMNGNRAYLGEVKNCPGLTKWTTLSYDATINKLCNTTIIHLLDISSPVPERGACGIDRFEKLEKLEKK